MGCFIKYLPPRKFAKNPHKIRAKASFKSDKLCVEIYADKLFTQIA